MVSGNHASSNSTQKVIQELQHSVGSVLANPWSRIDTLNIFYLLYLIPFIHSSSFLISWLCVEILWPHFWPMVNLFHCPSFAVQFFWDLVLGNQRKSLIVWTWTHNQTPYVQNYLFKFVTCYMHILLFIVLHGMYYVVNFILFSLENDDMESSKRCVKLLSLIFIIRCLMPTITVNKQINQSIWSIDQSINKTNQSINWSINQSIKSINQSISQTINQSMNESIKQ